jgi:Flp pilus assembly protein TadB
MTGGTDAALAAVAALCAGAAVWTLCPPAGRPLLQGPVARAAGASGASRGSAGVPAATRAGGSAAGQLGRRHLTAPLLSRILAVASAGSAIWLLEGSGLGACLGAGFSVAMWRWLAGLETRAQRARRSRVAAELPVAADLLAACLSSGCALSDAAVATARALGGPVGEVLERAVVLQSLGGDPSSCWEVVAREPGLEPLGKAVARAVRSGAPMAQVVEALSEDARQRRRAAAETQARAIGVKAAAPVGLCFLPAFLLVGVVPVVLGAAQGVFGSGG